MASIQKIRGSVTLLSGSITLCEGIPATLDISKGHRIEWSVSDIPSVADMDSIVDLMKAHVAIEFLFEPLSTSQAYAGQVFINKVEGLEQGSSLAVTGTSPLQGFDISTL
jgi:hypothetical protein